VHLAAAATRDDGEQQGGERLLDSLAHDVTSVDRIARGQCIFPAKLMCILPAKLMCIFPACAFNVTPPRTKGSATTCRYVVVDDCVVRLYGGRSGLA
jgi:hypothetical protein